MLFSCFVKILVSARGYAQLYQFFFIVLQLYDIFIISCLLHSCKKSFDLFFTKSFCSPTSSSHKKSTVDGGSVPKERYERTKSSLETELRDLRERYLEMSLKYAEVESEREDLVMKLKANRSGKRWFG